MKHSQGIAVIIPTCKPQEYLKQCLKSIDVQTLSKDKFCVYIALNGDKIPYENEILSLLKSHSFKSEYVYIEEPGVSNARNQLIDFSKEKFVAFVDDDDLISANYLNDLLKVSTDKSVGIAKVYSFKESIDAATNHRIGASYEKLCLSEASKFKARKYYSPICAKLIHRDIIGDIRFDINVKNGEDSLFMATISKSIEKLCKPHEEACYYIYERPESASRKEIPLNNRIKNYIYLIIEYLKLLFLPRYDRWFILTRIVATLKKMILGLN